MWFVRYFHSSTLHYRPAVAAGKSALAKLRKSTGYSFTKCKEALEKHDNDLTQAEKWLIGQAQAHGWEKATKLKGRSTMQGLVSILTNPSSAVMIEVNCETDFVARNKKFQNLVQRVSQSCYLFANDQQTSQGSTVLKVPLSGEDLENLPTQESKAVKDEIVLAIGQLGENIKARRAVYVKSESPILLAGYTHPAAPDGTILGKDVVQYGKYGAIIAYRSLLSEAGKKRSNEANAKLAEVGRQLCQHIVGMNPKEIGCLDDLPERKSDSSIDVSKSQLDGIEEIKEDGEPVFKSVPEIEESVLVNQEFLLDPDMTVREYLIQNSVEVLDFVRFECGEVTEPSQLE